MHFLKRLFDFILFGNIYVALGAVCLIQSSIIQMGMTNHLFAYSTLTFFASIFVYNFQRVFYTPTENSSLHSIRRKWIHEHQPAIKILAFAGITGVSISFFFNDPHIILYLSPLLALSLAYFIPAIRLRKSPLFKLLTLTIVWTMVTAVVPMMLAHIPLSSFPAILHILVRFFFMIAICIPFDIRDLEIDKADNISTIPHILGENTTRWIAFVFMLLYISLIIVENNLWMFDRATYYGLMISAIINTGFVLMTTPKRNEYFFVAGLDGTMILQGLILLLVYYL